MSDPLKRKVHRLNALNEYQGLKRTEFQAWFGKLMTECWPDDFLKIRLSKGDGGLDGYRISTKCVFQVFAPRHSTASEMAGKITEDFATAVATLAEKDIVMNEWVFVHNDPDDFPHEAVTAMASLKEKNPDVEFRRWDFAAIWNHVSKLTDEKLDEVFGDAPSIGMLESLQFSEIIPVVDWLHGTDPPNLPTLDLPDPQKLEYNALSVDNSGLVEIGRTRSPLVDEYLSQMPDADRAEAIAESYRDKYQALRDAGLPADDIFQNLWVFSGGEHFAGSPAGLAAVATVMAYFFDRCDIFENVPEQQ